MPISRFFYLGEEELKTSPPVVKEEGGTKSSSNPNEEKDATKVLGVESTQQRSPPPPSTGTTTTATATMDGHFFDDAASIVTEHEDASSVFGWSGETGRVRKRSVCYENPELLKMVKGGSRSSLSSVNKMKLDDDATSLIALSEVKEERDRENAAPGSATATAIDMIYEMFKQSDSDTGKVSVKEFLTTLTATGIKTTDPRLDESMHALHRITTRYGTDFDSASVLHLSEKDFKEMIRPNALTISRFLRMNFVIPEWNEFCRHVFRIYAMCKANNNGETSNFTQQLASYDKSLWGISVCTVDGQRFNAGDHNVPFCLQAASRVLNYAIALNDLGAEKVHNYVGQEPSGRNTRELVLDECNKPHNPMINAGAIVITAILKSLEKHMADRFENVHNLYKRMAGTKEFIGYCHQAYLCERQISYRNYALGYFLRENKCLPEPHRLEETLELMLQLCAVEVSCESLSVMAATLANGGVCPITGEYVLGSNCVRDVLSLMYTTGMNDYSGQFAFHVGLPAKSSISGAIMLVIPNVMGIALWSPPLDCRTNSVRGIQFCTEFVKTFNFHNYDNLRFTERKMDPRKMQVENKAHQVVLTLFSAANGDLTALTRFYLQSIDLTVADYDRRTPLHVAAAEGHLHCVKFLVEKARVPSRPVDRWNNTPADDARYHNHPDVAEYLENWDLNRTVGSNSHLTSSARKSAPEIGSTIHQNGSATKSAVSFKNGPHSTNNNYDDASLHSETEEEEEQRSDSGLGSSKQNSLASPRKD